MISGGNIQALFYTSGIALRVSDVSSGYRSSSWPTPVRMSLPWSGRFCKPCLSWLIPATKAQVTVSMSR